MPLHAADPGYQSFEKKCAADRCCARPWASRDEEHCECEAAAGDCREGLPLYVLSLPVHCVALGCTTIGQVEDDVRIAQEFKRWTSEA